MVDKRTNRQDNPLDPPTREDGQTEDVTTKDVTIEEDRTPAKEENPPREQKGPEESQIVHRVNVVDSNTGEPKIVEHGPMPVSEWSAYEKEHKL